MAVNYMGGANAQLSRIRRKQEGNTLSVRPTARREPAISPRLSAHSPDDTATGRAPTSVVSQRLYAFIEQRQGSRDYAAHQPLRNLKQQQQQQQQTPAGRSEVYFKSPIHHSAQSTDIEEGKQRTLEQIDAVFDDLFNRKRRRHKRSYRSKRILSSQDVAKPSCSRPVSQSEEQDIETHPSLGHLPARHEEPDIPVAYERQEDVMLDGTRFEKSIKGLFSELRHPIADAAAKLSYSSAVSAAPSGSSKAPPPAIATPPRVYTPVALPLTHPAFARSSNHSDEEVQRLEKDLLDARILLEKDFTGTWAARLGENGH